MRFERERDQLTIARVPSTASVLARSFRRSSIPCSLGSAKAQALSKDAQPCVYQRRSDDPLSRQHVHQFRRSAVVPRRRSQASRRRNHVVNTAERPSHPPNPRRTRGCRRRPCCHCGARHAHCGDQSQRSHPEDLGGSEYSHPEARGGNVPSQRRLHAANRASGTASGRRRGKRRPRPSRSRRQHRVKPDGASQSRSTGNPIAARAVAGQGSARLAPPVAAQQ